MSGCYPQDFDALGPPFAAAILLGGDSNLLPCGYALHTALAVFDYGHTFTENHFGMRDLDSSQHMVAALNEDPSLNKRLTQWRINHSALKSAVDRPIERTQTEDQ